MSLATAASVSVVTTLAHLTFPTGHGPVINVSLPPISNARSAIPANLRLDYVSIPLPSWSPVSPTPADDPIFTILPVFPNIDSMFASAARSSSVTTQEGEPIFSILPINADFPGPGSLTIDDTLNEDNAEANGEQEEQVENESVKREFNDRLRTSFRDNRKQSLAGTGKVGVRAMTTFATSTIARVV
jgi:hypothetical protein